VCAKQRHKQPPATLFIYVLQYTLLLKIIATRQVFREVPSKFAVFQDVKLCIVKGIYRGFKNQITGGYRKSLSGIESRWGRDFPPVQTGPGAHPASCTMGTVSFQGVKCGRSVLLTTHPLPVPQSWKSRAIPLPTLWATPAL